MNVNDNHIVNVGLHRVADIQTNAEIIQLLIVQLPRYSVACLATCTGERKMTTHCILRHSLHTFCTSYRLSDAMQE